VLPNGKLKERGHIPRINKIKIEVDASSDEESASKIKGYLPADLLQVDLRK